MSNVASSKSNAKARLFISYSHKDEALRDELEEHLSLLKRQGFIHAWYDRRIGAGEEWKSAIDENLEAANVILLLVSAAFLASDYCYDTEMKRALEKHEAGEARVIPVIMRPVDWSGAPFSKLQGLPKDAKPVTSWLNRDEAWTDVAKGIRKAIETVFSIQEQEHQEGEAHEKAEEERKAQVEKIAKPSRLPLSFDSGLYGGVIGGGVAGLVIVIGYYVEGKKLDLWEILLTFLLACLTGMLLGICTQLTIPWFRHLVTEGRCSARVLLIGGSLGGLIAGIIAGVLGGWLFGLREGPPISPELLVASAVIGTIFFTLYVLLYGYRGRLRDVMPTLLLSVIPSVFMIIIGGS